ncbi:MAG TPA: hypothetical protein VKK79_03240 [Candidatus Lokiarchaeia archaeon]|nr:hypothetical protein [Candidatus Lokiarchaeia archaeon]
MPLRIKWFQGKYSTILLMFFGIAGLFQAIFIAIGEFASDVGSDYAVTLIPVIVTLCIGFSSGILYEARLQQQKRVQHHRKYQKTLGVFQRNELFLPILVPLIAFAALFFPTFYLVVLGTTPLASFIIAENVGAIGTLVIASVLEKTYAPHANPY